MNDGEDPEAAVARIAAAIGDPARARMLYCLMDGHARTSTELAAVAGVSPPTASAHLNRLRSARLVEPRQQGRHRYYGLTGAHTAAVLEKLSVLAGGSRQEFVPSTPDGLRAARSCYDHLAGSLGVSLHDRMHASGWLTRLRKGPADAYDLTPAGAKAFEALGVDVEAERRSRRRLAFGCLDWSERRPHLGGALGAALLDAALKRKWVLQELDSRALEITSRGRREFLARFGVRV